VRRETNLYLEDIIDVCRKIERCRFPRFWLVRERISEHLRRN
jgi:hypothetical protein